MVAFTRLVFFPISVRNRITLTAAELSVSVGHMGIRSFGNRTAYEYSPCTFSFFSPNYFHTSSKRRWGILAPSASYFNVFSDVRSILLMLIGNLLMRLILNIFRRDYVLSRVAKFVKIGSQITPNPPPLSKMNFRECTFAVAHFVLLFLL